jgi:hypothetical protein
LIGFEVDIVDMSLRISFVADQVFPVTALPDAPFPLREAARGSPFNGRQPPGESRFDLRPAIGVVRIALG